MEQLFFTIPAVCAAVVVVVRMWRRGRERTALLLRIENAPDLRRGLGTTGMAELTGRIMQRAAQFLGRDLGALPEVRTEVAGELCILVPSARPAQLRGRVLRLQAALKSGIQIRSGRVMPAISAVMVRDPAGGATTPQLHDFARKLGMGAKGGLVVGTYYEAQAALGEVLAPVFTPERVETWFVPQLCTDTGTVIGTELEPRLRHPDLGLLTPPEFASLLDPQEMVLLVKTALAQGLQALRQWDRRAIGVDHLTLRLEAAHLGQDALADFLLWELDRQDVPPLRLVISVAKAQDLAGGPSNAALNLDRLSAAGCAIELVDLGAEGPSLKGLRRFNPRRLRLGEAFVAECDRSPDQQRMILAIMALADHLGLEAVAEEVATQGEHAYLAQIGVAQVQGRAVARALPADLMPGYLEECDRKAHLASPLRRAS